MKRYLRAAMAVAIFCVAAAVHAQSCPTLDFGPMLLPDATLNQPYSQLLSPNSGTPPYTFTLKSGSFPPGIRINQNRLEGTPSVSGSFSFTIMMTDGSGCTGSRAYTLKVEDPSTPVCNNSIVISPTAIPVGVVGQGYQARFTASGGTSPYTIAFGGASFPPGMIFTNNMLTGTPSRVGTFGFDLTAKDARGCTSTQHYELNVVAQSCPQDVASILRPVSGEVLDPSKPVVFSWTAVPNASRYEVLVSNDGGTTFNTVGSTSDASSTSATVSLNPGTYLGIVQTIFSASCVTRSSPLRFTVGSASACPSGPPAPIAPASGITNNSPSVMFEWTPIANATKYEVFTSVNGAAFTSIAETTGSTVTRIVPSGSIDWYVEASSPNCTPQRSITVRFSQTQTATCPTGSISLLAPQNGATVLSPVTFTWTGIPGATAYRVWMAIDNGNAANAARVTTTTATLPVPNGSIEWYVEAIFNNCPSIFSSHNKITVPRSTTCGNASPTPTSPINADVTASVTFKWNAAPGASAYRLWISMGGDPFTDSGVTSNTQLDRDLAPGSYSWFVDAIYSGCPSVSSQTVSFRVPDTVATCSSAAPSTLTPANGASSVSSPVTFSWTPVADANEYRVFASINGGALQLIGKTGDVTLTKSIPAGSIVWFVEAAFKGCAATHSAVARFTIPQSTCPKQKPQLLTPPDGTTNATSPVTFSWTAVPGAVRYVLIAKAAHGAPSVLGETTLTQLDRDVPSGDIQWWVAAIGSGCDGTVSDKSTFTVPEPANCASRRPHPLQPEDDSVNAASPVHFAWTKSPRASSYRLFAAIGSDEPSLVATTTATAIDVPMPAGKLRWFVEAVIDNCPALFSAINDVTVAGTPAKCTAPDRPVAHVVAQVLSATDYNVRWTGVTGASVYELQESTTASFAGVPIISVSGVSMTFNHVATTAPQQYFYRVRAVSSCSDDRSAYSRVVSTRVIPPNTTAARNKGTAEIGVQNSVVQTITIPAANAGQQFSARADKPWLTVTPSSGTVPPGGITLTVTSDPKALAAGANHGTIHITYSSPGPNSRLETNASTPPATVPISISLVTPVAPDTKATPPPDSLIIPAVAHGPGANGSLFLSDIRLANVSSQAMKYLLNFTPTATDGTQSGTTTTIQVDPGATTALDDILSSFFGTASDGSSSGMLEIRPLSATNTSSLFSSVPSDILSTVASSRTYNITPAGTFGQFIPAIPFSQFVGKGSVLSLQQIAQSANYRTNFGLLEAAGEPADVVLHVFDKSGNKLADIPESLVPSEHLPLNGLLAANNITLDDGRVEVEVVSSTGKVSAYASVIDNRTNDPLLVSPVLKGSVNSNRYVIPGVAYTNSVANWRTDARLYNSGSTAVIATLTFYPQVGSADLTPIVRTITINPGETKALDNVLNTTFGISVPTAGGSVLVTTPSASGIIASARTYALASGGGTIGQFVPAVTPPDSVGAGDRSLQLLQLESSDQFRTNIGIAETTGNPATVEVSLVLPDSKVTPVITISLDANQFTQLSLASFGLTDAIYNARVAVRVADGSGKVTAYGSLIDNASQDPTYVPAQ